MSQIVMRASQLKADAIAVDTIFQVTLATACYIYRVYVNKIMRWKLKKACSVYSYNNWTSDIKHFTSCSGNKNRAQIFWLLAVSGLSKTRTVTCNSRVERIHPLIASSNAAVRGIQHNERYGTSYRRRRPLHPNMHEPKSDSTLQVR